MDWLDFDRDFLDLKINTMLLRDSDWSIETRRYNMGRADGSGCVDDLNAKLRDRASVHIVATDFNPLRESRGCFEAGLYN